MADHQSTIIMQHVQDSTNNLLRDRRWRLRKYKACLEAKETLTSIVEAALVKDRAEGVLVLRRCVEAGYLAHVTNQSHFTDTYLFFRVVTNTKGDGGQQLPSLAEAKETEGSKHGPASVRCRGLPKIVISSCQTVSCTSIPMRMHHFQC